MIPLARRAAIVAATILALAVYAWVAVNAFPLHSTPTDPSSALPWLNGRP